MRNKINQLQGKLSLVDSSDSQSKQYIEGAESIVSFDISIDPELFKALEEAIKTLECIYYFAFLLFSL